MTGSYRLRISGLIRLIPQWWKNALRLWGW